MSASVSVAENQTAVTAVTSSDPDAGASRTFALSGADASKFAISAGGVLSFKAAPDFETPGDAGGNNLYNVTVTVKDDGTLTDSQNLAVRVTNANEAPTISSSGIGPNGAISVVENRTAVARVTVADPDAGALRTFALSGADAAKFAISAGGVLTFKAAPDFEKPGDANGDNVYAVVVTVKDDGDLTDSQSLAVTVGDAVDIVRGTAKNDKLRGATGADDIRGQGGNDKLFGEQAGDILDGGNGNDLMVGGGGADKLRGGKGTDTASHQEAEKGVTASLADASKNRGEARGDAYGSVENLTGSAHGDRLTGDGKANVLKGLSGNDVLDGGNGGDVVKGGGGNDRLKGGDGKDRIEGNGGRDTKTGGDGADSFVFRSVNDSPNQKKAWDIVTDFRQGQGDLIDLKAIDAKTGKKNHAFTFIGDDAFTGAKGELRFDTRATKTFVYGDTNGDGTADLRIELKGAIELVKGDFVV